MAKINILSSKIYNLIAAGEVVERPASVVKELLDNCIDAGADDITIEILEGGIKKISIKDNGHGIEKDYVQTAFLRHATSKIEKESDLSGIKTLGFRGEALSSIASVSMVTIQTKTKNNDTGIHITLKGGELQDEYECAMNEGTVINVSNLFYNTPARLKFLKTQRSEEGEITNIISRYILANPNLRILYKANNKVVYQSYGSGLKDAISCVYGREALSNIIELKSSYNGFSLYGFIGKPSYTKNNRSYQTLVINGRYVLNTTVSAAIANAYNDFMMKRQYPFYVLHLQLPNNFIDVNVHPNKLDVRFEDNKKVFQAFYQPVYSKLHNHAQDIVLCNSTIQDQKPSNTETLNANQSNGASYTQSILNRYDKERDFNPHNIKVSDVYIEDLYGINKNIANQSNLTNLQNTEILENDIQDKPQRLSDDFAATDKTSFHNRSDVFNMSLGQDKTHTFNDVAKNIISTDNAYQKTESFLSETFKNQNVNLIDALADDEVNIKCNLFNTYIVVEIKNNIYLIDQHAAHERILYDKITNNYNSGDLAIQDLLVPYIFNANSAESNFIVENMKVLNDIGFMIEEFGDLTFKISAVPAVFSEVNLSSFIEDLLSDINTYKQLSSIDFVKEKLMQKACKAAVKAGDNLNKEEIIALIKQLFDNKVLLCPHGRPVVLSYSKNDIEKLFKRIV